MASFGKTSKERLYTAHPDLQRLFEVIVKEMDCSVVYGARTVEEQRALVAAGASKTMNSKHLVQSDGWAHAVDVAPYPINWDNMKRFYFFAGKVTERARVMGIPLRWGGDWDSDNDLDDQTFMDLVHFELVT